MNHSSERETLDHLINTARRRLFLKTAAFHMVRASLWLLPLTALIIAINQRWLNQSGNAQLALAGAGLIVAIALVNAFYEIGRKLRSALAIDEGAHLKDRITSAYEFLAAGPLDEARQLQVRDAIQHAQSVQSHPMFRFEWPRAVVYLPIAILLFALSWFVPPAFSTRAVQAAVDPVKQLQIEELRELQAQLAKEEEPVAELKELTEKLKQIQKRFEEGEISERDVMLELARLDEDLRQKANELGAENLEGEMNTIVPHLMSAAASQQLAAALKENEMEKAEQELAELAEKVKAKALSKEEKRELAMNMGVCASKLGGKEKNSFGGDFGKASESLESDDSEGFESACKSIGDKLGLLKKMKSMTAACKKLGNCKACLGQCESKEKGYSQAPKTQNKGKGGLKAGTAASGDPFGEKSRLEDGYRNMLRVAGQAGSGPVESETEITEGQLSQSQVNLKELHADFEAVAEEAIENEAIPLSHRYHVKRYFQSIRPKE